MIAPRGLDVHGPLSKTCFRVELACRLLRCVLMNSIMDTRRVSVRANTPVEPVFIEEEEWKRILLADDDDELRDSLALALHMSGFEVTAVADGVGVLDKLGDWILGQTKEVPFDLIIVDVLMPGLSGLHIVEGLQAGKYPRPMMVISGLTNPSSIHRVQQLAPDVAFVPKPVDLESLTWRVTNLMQQGRLRYQASRR